MCMCSSYAICDDTGSIVNVPSIYANDHVFSFFIHSLRPSTVRWTPIVHINIPVYLGGWSSVSGQSERPQQHVYSSSGSGLRRGLLALVPAPARQTVFHVSYVRVISTVEISSSGVLS